MDLFEFHTSFLLTFQHIHQFITLGRQIIPH